MKAPFLFSYSAAIIIATAIASCSNEPETQQQLLQTSAIQFDNTHVRLDENGATQTITLSLNIPALRDGSIELEFDKPTPRLNINPVLPGNRMSLAIAKGQQKVSFDVKPEDNALPDGNATLKATIVSMSPGLVLGTQKTIEIALIDNENPGDPNRTIASFAAGTSVVKENQAQGHEIVINFTNPLPGEGSIEINIASAKATYGIDYVTQPPAFNGKILVTPETGSSRAAIKVIPSDNGAIGGNLTLALTMSNTFGAIIPGEQVVHELAISDDELAAFAKGYSIGGSLGLRKTYTYDALGRIASVYIESGISVRNDTYHYGDDGKIQRINAYPGIDRVFTWTGDKITRSESIEFGVRKEYTDYDYDSNGNVAGSDHFYRQPSGEFKRTATIVYLYFNDNNIYKSLYYVPVEGSDELMLLNTKTYDNYRPVANPFPMVKILPTVKTMTMLPGSYREQSNGYDLLYTIDYDFLPDGRVNHRYARNGSQVETVSYYYF